jgi:hypothetical protein
MFDQLVESEEFFIGLPHLKKCKEMLDIGCGLEENKFSFSFLSVPGYLMGVEWLISQSRGVKIQELT